MTVAGLIALWIATTYGLIGWGFGNWRDNFGYYARAPWWLPAVTNVVLPFVSLPLWVVTNRLTKGKFSPVDWDWPLRVAHNGRRSAQTGTTVAEAAALAQKAMHQNMAQTLYGNGGGSHGGGGAGGAATIQVGPSGSIVIGVQGSPYVDPPEMTLVGPMDLAIAGIKVIVHHLNFGLLPDLTDLAIAGIKVIVHHLNFGLLPDLTVPDTLGYRSWMFDPSSGVLRSPHQGTLWHEAELHCEAWNEGDVVRGVSGIHAHRVPCNWRQAPSEMGIPVGPLAGTLQATIVTGLVERYGRYVLGTEGWRAEWVVIKALHAPNRVVAAALREMYPEVEVTHYADR